MKYTLSITINKPRERVIELFDNTENLSKWQKGLISFEHISGEKGQTGAKSKLIYEMNGRKTEMIETIKVRKLPKEFSATYETKGVFNNQVNRFIEEGPEKTIWMTESEFKFSGFMKIIGFFFKSSFPKTSLKFMKDFKDFVERS